MRLPTYLSVFALSTYQLVRAAPLQPLEDATDIAVAPKEDHWRNSPAYSHPPASFNSTTAGFVVGGVVKTSSGSVRGHPAALAPEVSEYLGIPYAMPATGQRRFAAPVAFLGNGIGILPGDKYIQDCPASSGLAASAGPASGPLPGPPSGVPDAGSPDAQSAMIFAKYGASTGAGNNNTGEDCLGINVWTKPQVGEKAKAVMMWIYGGGFQSGTSHATAYNGAKIVDQEDVIVVTFNYRTNIFGFGSPPNSTDHNFGFLDQRMAVQWVQANIAGFGGDPTRITLFGQSAGGSSVDIYAYAWTQDPIVNAFIPESGAAGVLDLGDPTAEQKWFNVSIALGCGGPEAAASSLSCVQKKPLADVMKAAAVITDGFIPVVDNVTLFSDYVARGTAGNFIKRPILVGSNSNEARIFAAGAALGGITLPEELQAGINADFTCPAGDAARYRSMNNVKAYRYVYQGDWPNLNISTTEKGAFHSAEVPMVWDSAEDITGVPNTYAETATANLMRSIWTTFAKDPDNGLDSFGLPVYDPNGTTLIQLGDADQVLPVLAPSTKFDGPCNGTLIPFNPNLR